MKGNVVFGLIAIVNAGFANDKRWIGESGKLTTQVKLSTLASKAGAIPLTLCATRSYRGLLWSRQERCCHVKNSAVLDRIDAEAGAATLCEAKVSKWQGFGDCLCIGHPDKGLAKHALGIPNSSGKIAWANYCVTPSLSRWILEGLDCPDPWDPTMIFGGTTDVL
ncbi:hypothetical protein RJ55_07343 [Drechmeria coniospora]|nr:hypothetical protein RJ55_07343 [Drechmeria coniospora]